MAFLTALIAKTRASVTALSQPQHRQERGSLSCGLLHSMQQPGTCLARVIDIQATTLSAGTLRLPIAINACPVEKRGFLVFPVASSLMTDC